MRILIVSQYFWPENFRINEVAKSLRIKGIDVEILTAKPNYPSGKFFTGYRGWGCMQQDWFGIKIHRVPLFPRGKSGFGLMANYLSFILSAILVGPWLLRGKRFDAIFIFGSSPIFQAIPAIFFGRLKKSPLILWIQDLWPESLSVTGYISNKKFLKIIEFLVKWVYLSMDLLLVQSRGFISKVRGLSGAVPIIYHPNFFVEEAVENLHERTYCAGFDCAFPVLFAGNIGKAQAVDVILEAAAKLQDIEDIHIVMVGDGSQRNWMMQEVKSRGLENITFPGQFKVEEMPSLMEQSAALIVTLADNEILNLTIPSKIQAYLAAGRPIIGCLNGSGADILEEAKAGIVVSSGDAFGLSRAIRCLYNLSHDERLAMGANGRRYYDKNFSFNKSMENLIEHINQAILLHQRRV